MRVGANVIPSPLVIHSLTIGGQFVHVNRTAAVMEESTRNPREADVFVTFRNCLFLFAVHILGLIMGPITLKCAVHRFGDQLQ